MSKYGSFERARVLKVYNDPGAGKFRAVCDFWAEVMYRYQLPPLILEDALKVASIFSAQPELWKKQKEKNRID